MADFFGKLKKGLNKATTTVGAKSQNLMDVNKLKGEIAAIGRERKTTFENIGEKIYEMKLAGAIELSQVEELLTKLEALDLKKDELAAKIEVLNAELEDKLSALDDVEVVPEEASVNSEPVSKETVVTVEVVKEEVVTEEVKPEAVTSTTEETNEDGIVTGEYKA